MKEARSIHAVSVVAYEDYANWCEAPTTTTTSTTTTTTTTTTSATEKGILASGGYNGGNLKSVEIYNPVSNISCSLPEFPSQRQRHSQDGALACGGGGNDKNCVKWSSDSGTWTQSHTLIQRRYYHVSWNTDDGVYLMGGAYSLKTTELVKNDGTVEDGFSLQYDTK